jgi:hypothetical protein
MTKKTKPSLLKGVYKLNPTTMTLKEGSAKARRAVTENVPGFKKIKPVTKTANKGKRK